MISLYEAYPGETGQTGMLLCIDVGLSKSLKDNESAEWPLTLFDSSRGMCGIGIRRSFLVIKYILLCSC